MDPVTRLIFAAAGDAIRGQAAFTTPGTFSWTVPGGVRSISVVCVEGGAGGQVQRGGNGGMLAYSNAVPVVPGETLTVVVGSGGAGSDTDEFGLRRPPSGSASALRRGATALAQARWNAPVGDAVFDGGEGGWGRTVRPASFGTSRTFSGGGGGGAAGYAGPGGRGNNTSTGQPTAGQGGGGGGGGHRTSDVFGAEGAATGGGGVGIFGQGANGAAGASGENSASPGGGGSGGDDGGEPSSFSSPTPGGAFGGGGGGGMRLFDDVSGAPGGGGAVRIIWPGTQRQFPSTRTGDE